MSEGVWISIGAVKATEHLSRFPNGGGVPSSASQMLVGVHGRAAIRIRASREWSGPWVRCADDEVRGPKARPASARCDDLRLGAVYTLATRNESRQHMGWASRVAVKDPSLNQGDVPALRTSRLAAKVCRCPPTISPTADVGQQRRRQPW